MTTKNDRTPPATGVLAGTRVIDLSGPEAWLCGMLLAGFGAEVIKIEPPGGDPGRHLAPRAAGRPEVVSLNWFAWNRGKRSLELDLANPADAASLRELVEGSEFLIESRSPGGLREIGLDYASASVANPGLVYVSVTPFGQSGPYSSYVGSDLIAMAAGGHMSLDGLPDLPMRPSIDSAYVQGGAQAATGAMIAHYHRQRTGVGQQVDVSLQEAVAVTLDEHSPGWDILHEVHGRMGSGRWVSRAKAARTAFRCKDGWVCGLYYFGLIVALDAATELLRRCGIPHDDILTPEWRRKLMEEFGSTLTEAEEARLVELAEQVTAHFTRAELVAECERLKLFAGEVNSPADLLLDPHLRARGFWRKAELPGLGEVEVPGPPFILSDSPWQTPVTLEPAAPRTAARPRATRRSVEHASRGVFDGLRVADFAWVGVGPLTSKYLADQGAEVIRIESTRHPDILRTIPPFVDDVVDLDLAGYYANFNSSKLGASLNFQHPRAAELALKLIDTCDIVTDTYRPGVMERWGISYEEVSRRRPEIIWFRGPMFGLSGPRSSGGGYGNTLQAITGIYHLLGEKGGEPLGANTAFTDFLIPHFAATAIIAALEHRRQTGRGQLIEVAQIETAMYLLPVQVLEVQVNRTDPGADGNRHPEAAPHNAYRCLGEDRFAALACFTDAHWQALRVEMGDPAWAGEARFGTLEGRKQHEVELDRLVGSWAAGQVAEEVMHRLQRRGVPAALVATLEDLHKDPQLAHRQHYRYLDHPRMGRRAYDGPAFRLSSTPERLSRPAPMLGQHNDYVWRELVGLPEEEIAQLLIEGAFE